MSRGIREAARELLRRDRGWRTHPTYGDSYLYAIEGAGLLKIGSANSPEERTSQLQTGSPVPLTLLAAVPEYIVSEKEAHGAWAHLRQHGEWFTFTPELQRWVAGLREIESTHKSLSERLHALAYGPERRPLSGLIRAEASTGAYTARQGPRRVRFHPPLTGGAP